MTTLKIEIRSATDEDVLRLLHRLAFAMLGQRRLVTVGGSDEFGNYKVKVKRDSAK